MTGDGIVGVDQSFLGLVHGRVGEQKARRYGSSSSSSSLSSSISILDVDGQDWDCVTVGIEDTDLLFVGVLGVVVDAWLFWI